MNATTTTATASATASAAKGAKRIVKKTAAAADAATATAATVTETVAPAVASTTATTATAATEVPAATPAAPEAQAVTKVKPVTTVAEELAAAIKQLTAIRDSAAENIMTLKRLEKVHVRELKEARKRRRVKKTEDAVEGGGAGAESKSNRPCIFEIPVKLKDELCELLGKPAGTMMTPADVNHAIHVYIDEHNLKSEEKNMIKPNDAMCTTFGLPKGESFARRSIQTHLFKLYIRDAAAAAAAAAAK